jgi:two-component system, NtrC family, nitrogen regulation response regulator NtrX
MAIDILIVDDEADIRELVSGILEDEGYETRSASDSDSALASIESRLPSLLILDIWLQGSRLDGLELLELIRKKHTDLPVIVISGHGNIETAVAAIKKGAYDFIEKPFKSDHLLLTIERATENEKLRRENKELREKVGVVDGLLGKSQHISTVRQTLDRVANTNSRILIKGEPGSGKEMLVRLVHNRSQRSESALIVTSIAAISPKNIDQELFGVEQNGGVVKTGLYERAHGGTLYIDEILDIPLPTQAKLLRVLTENSFERVGGTTKVKVDVRIITASSRDLTLAMESGSFREDLYHRLNVVSVDMPPLRDRREDIPMLTENFSEQVARANGLSPRMFLPEAIATMQTYDWPGNVRQLKNIIERVLIMADRSSVDPIAVLDLPGEVRGESQELLHGDSSGSIMTTPLRQAREVFEREYLKVQIGRFSGNISKTASFVGMERSALHRKLKTLGLSGNEQDAKD